MSGLLEHAATLRPPFLVCHDSPEHEERVLALARQLRRLRALPEVVPLDEPEARIADAHRDPAGAGLVAAGMRRLVEILRWLRVEP